MVSWRCFVKESCRILLLCLTRPRIRPKFRNRREKSGKSVQLSIRNDVISNKRKNTNTCTTQRFILFISRSFTRVDRQLQDHTTTTFTFHCKRQCQTNDELNKPKQCSHECAHALQCQTTTTHHMSNKRRAKQS